MNQCVMYFVCVCVCVLAVAISWLKCCVLDHYRRSHLNVRCSELQGNFQNADSQTMLYYK